MVTWVLVLVFMNGGTLTIGPYPGLDSCEWAKPTAQAMAEVLVEQEFQDAACHLRVEM